MVIKMRYDIAIVGSGPAGLSAAINAKIRNKNIIVFGNENLSNKLVKAPEINNYLAIIGYNKEAEEEANFLNEIASKTYFIPMYKNQGLMRGSNLEESIEVISERPIEIEGETLVNKVSFKNKYINVDGVFVIKDSASPKTLVPGLEVDGSHVKVDINMQTNIEGCFACGDIAGKPYSYIKSAGQGQIAAINAVSYLDQLKIKEKSKQA